MATLPCHRISQIGLVLQDKDALIASQSRAITQAMTMMRSQKERLQHLQQVEEQLQVTTQESAVRQYPVTMQCV